MALWAEFVDGAYTTRSANIDTEALFNLYKETLDNASNPKKKSLIGTPGLTSQTTVIVSGGIGVSPGCRGMFSHDGRTFAMVAQVLFDLTLTGSGPTLAITTANRGTVTDDGLPVFWAAGSFSVIS